MQMLDRLVDRLFDYAGMFPPAALTFDDALRLSARLPTMLHRPHLVNADMVVKREHLPLMDDARLGAAGFDATRTVRTCLVGVPLEDGLLALEQTRAFDAAGSRALVPRKVVSLEAATEAPAPDDSIDALARAARDADTALYVEPRWPLETWRARLPPLVERLSAAGPHVGLKLRCAGPTALDAPTLAFALRLVAEASVPLKATQGLHHPLVEPERYGNPIGFLGLTLGLRLAAVAPPDEATLVRCLTEPDQHAFQFDRDRIIWQGHALDSDALTRAARSVPFQIGSCSLDEPDDDLRRLYG